MALNRVFNVLTLAFNLLTRGFELVAHGFELVTHGFERATHNSCFPLQCIASLTQFTIFEEDSCRKSYYLIILNMNCQLHFFIFSILVIVSIISY